MTVHDDDYEDDNNSDNDIVVVSVNRCFVARSGTRDVGSILVGAGSALHTDSP